MENINKNLIYANITKEEINKIYLEEKYYLDCIAYKVFKESKINVELEELRSEASLIFLSSIRKFDKSYNIKLQTYLFNKVYFFLKNYVRDNYKKHSYNKVKYDINDLNLQNENNEINELIKEDSNKKIINKIKETLNNKQLNYFNKILEVEDFEEKRINNFKDKQVFKSIKLQCYKNNLIN